MAGSVNDHTPASRTSRRHRGVVHSGISTEVIAIVSTSKQPRSSTTPLGGSSHKRDRFARSWTGYVPLVRVCPACGTENAHTARFCAGCAARIDGITPAPSNDPNSGVRAMQERLRKESEEARRSRPFVPDGGTGFIITGVVLLAVASLFPIPLLLRLGLWALGLVATGTGLVRMRFDGDAIRRTGFLLAGAAIALIALVVTRGTPPPDTEGLLATSTPPAAVIAAASPVATPVVAGIDGQVATWLGDAAHSGAQPGPAPDQNPRLAWRFDTGNEILASPIVADGMVFVTNRAGTLYAVDAATGQQLWRVALGKYVVRTSPTYHDGTLYLVAGFDAIAFDARTGEQRWKTSIRYAGTASPTVTRTAMYVVSQEGWLYAFSLKDGSELWKTTTDGISFGSPSVRGDRMVVGTDRGLVIGVNPETGRQAWKRDFTSPVYATPVIAGDTVWVVTDDGMLRGLDLATGEDRFALETTSDLTLTASGETLYVPSADGGLYAMNRKSGDVQWFASAGGAVEAGPVRTDDQVLIAGGNRIAGLDRKTGKQIWYFLAGDAIEAPPAVVSGYVFFGARDGVLYAVTTNPAS
jgi:outer membrane protein assembly factor BamB